MKRRKVKELELLDRPREKLIKYGPERLSSEELLAVILGSGTRKETVLNIAARLIRKFPGETLAEVDFAKLRSSDIGRSKACMLVASFELSRRLIGGKEASLLLSPRDVWDRMTDLRGEKKEYFAAFFLNVKNQEIRRAVISIGTLSANLVHPREVFEPAIRENAAHIIVSHNHPSGNLDPSDEDIRVTRRLAEAGKILGIDLLDHVIVSLHGFFSMAEKGIF